MGRAGLFYCNGSFTGSGFALLPALLFGAAFCLLKQR
jgi:hypothetical protein